MRKLNVVKENSKKAQEVKDTRLFDFIFDPTADQFFGEKQESYYEEM
jgi:hypothetical protein